MLSYIDRIIYIFKLTLKSHCIVFSSHVKLLSIVPCILDQCSRFPRLFWQCRSRACRFEQRLGEVFLQLASSGCSCILVTLDLWKYWHKFAFFATNFNAHMAANAVVIRCKGRPIVVGGADCRLWNLRSGRQNIATPSVLSLLQKPLSHLNLLKFLSLLHIV